jgi:hypothetical protein
MQINYSSNQLLPFDNYINLIEDFKSLSVGTRRSNIEEAAVLNPITIWTSRDLNPKLVDIFVLHHAEVAIYR